MKKPVKRPVSKKASISAAAPQRGCCTLTGNGPAEQHEGLTAEECRLLGIEKGKNDHWVPGRCAQP